MKKGPTAECGRACSRACLVYPAHIWAWFTSELVMPILRDIPLMGNSFGTPDMQ